MDEIEINALLATLSRPHASGGVVIERAAILAAGTDVPAVMAWISGHGGVAEAAVPTRGDRGLHGARSGHTEASGAVLRYILPAGLLR